MTRLHEPPVARVRAAPGAALSPDVLRALPAEALARWIASRRWFGGKGRPPREARFAEIIPLPWDHDAGDVRAAVTRVEVRTEGAPPATYQLPLVAHPFDDGARDALAIVDERGEGEPVAHAAVVEDALENERFRARLGAVLGAGGAFAGEGARWTIEPVDGGAAAGLDALPSRVGRAEQSNTSVVFGERVILKLFRRLEPGENPDVEITRFLTTRTAFRDAPALLAELRYDTAAGDSCTAGMLTDFVPGARDGWTVALEMLDAHLREVKAGKESREPENAFVPEAARLGRITRALHDALASAPDVPGFGVVPVTTSDVETWSDQAGAELDAALALLAKRADTLDARFRPMARAIAARGEAAHARLDEIARTARADVASEAGTDAAPQRSRCHGDYHLGQVLRAAGGGWMVVDFEGEPARPLAARRALVSPLRDVAGMLRSFAYAAATGVARASGGAVSAPVEVRAAHWERDVRGAFLDAYGAVEGNPLIALFELEKVFYELSYELNNRPAWAWIPLRGIAKIF